MNFDNYISVLKIIGTFSLPCALCLFPINTSLCCNYFLVSMTRDWFSAVLELYMNGIIQYVIFDLAFSLNIPDIIPCYCTNQ